MMGLFFCVQSCQKNASPPDISIILLSVTSGSYNTPVYITGTGYSSTLKNNAVFFNGKPATITAATPTQLSVLVPLGAGTGPVTIQVNNGAVYTGPVFTYVPLVMVSTVAGTGTVGLTSGAALSATYHLPWGIGLDNQGNVFTSEYVASGLIRELSQGNVSVFAGNVNQSTSVFPDGAGTAAAFNYPSGIAIDASNNIYVAEAYRVRKITSGAVVTSITIPGATGIYAVAVDANGNLFSADEIKNVIYKTTPAGVTTLFAGNGNTGTANGSGTAATFSNPMGMTIDKSGNLYVVDQLSNLIRKVTPAGVVSTLAGSGSPGSADGTGTAASFNSPTGIVIDNAGNLYVADTYNYKIRKIATDGTVTTVAGTGKQGSVDGDTKTAQFYSPRGVAVDESGNIYVTEFARIREITFQ